MELQTVLKPGRWPQQLTPATICLTLSTIDDEAHARTDQVRRFNRFYTRRIGVLQEGYLSSPFSLAEVRVLYELAHQPHTTASELARQLGLDRGYLSRILRKFGERGLLDRTQSKRDGREQHLSLTPHGQSTIVPLETTAREQIGAMLDQLSEAQQERMVGAMGTIQGLLEHSSDEPYQLRTEPIPGDFGWVVARHGALYAKEYAFDLTFEALVASIVAKFVDHYKPDCERVWIAERDGQRLGCVFLVKVSRRMAKLRLFLVEPDARGLGIGRRMVSELIVFARASGYCTIRLWTQSILLAARHLYAEFGFKLIDQEPNQSFGADLISETWELRL
jgi:DNA-binding MarR family transcriptional regulator/N-acetylglutamate synthase-like GNAT family acetyltransferase